MYLKDLREAELVGENDGALLLEDRHADEQVQVATRQVCPDYLQVNNARRPLVHK